jgi:hypothetical protein
MKLDFAAIINIVACRWLISQDRDLTSSHQAGVVKQRTTLCLLIGICVLIVSTDTIPPFYRALWFLGCFGIN